jgi:CheY-like chemotaxis protein
MQKLTILVVEDEFLIGKSICKKFEQLGHIAQFEPSGVEAINLGCQKYFDIIICDLMLQDISGFDVIEEIKTKSRTISANTKIIIMTAYSSEQVLDRAKSYHCKIFQKPFIELESTLLEMLS